MIKKVIIIRGPLGVGKTTIARKTAEILGAKYYSLDTVLKQARADQSGDIPLETFLKVNRKILPELKNNYQKNIVSIIDHNFYYPEHLEDLLQYFDDHLVVTLKAKLATCIERDREREKAYGEQTTKALYKICTKFNVGLVVDTDKNDIDMTIAHILEAVGV